MAESDPFYVFLPIALADSRPQSFSASSGLSEDFPAAAKVPSNTNQSQKEQVNETKVSSLSC